MSTVGEIGALHGRYVRQSDRFKAIWTYHQFASGVFKNVLNAPLPYTIDFQKIFERIKTISGSLTGTLAGEANAALTAVDTTLDRTAATLLTADQRIPASLLRRFFEKLRTTDDNIIHYLIKFYFYADAVEGDCRDKLDYLFTRVGEEFIEERGEYWTRDSLEFRERIIALVSILKLGAAPQDEVVRLIRAVRSLRDEIQKADKFEELTERNLLRNARMFKHRVGDLYFHPDVLLAIVELNVSTKNRFTKLYQAEEQRLMNDAAKLMEHSDAIERNFSDAHPQLVEEMARFRQYKERFDELRAQSNVKHDVITHLKLSMANILSQLDRGLDVDESTAELPESFFDETEQSEKLRERFGDDEVAMPYLLRIAAAVESLPTALTAAELVERAGVADLRLEPWEAGAYRQLFGARSDVTDLDADELAELYLRSAAIRLRIDELAMLIAAATAAGVRPDAETMQSAKRSLDAAKVIDDAFADLLRGQEYSNDEVVLRQLYRSRFRMLRGFSGLWLVYDGMSAV